MTTTPRARPRARLVLALAPLFALAAGGCRFAPDAAEVRAGIEARADLPGGRAAAVTAVPFVASDESDDCGAAALAAVLAKAGVSKGAGEIRAEIFDGGRGGAPTSALVRYARAQQVFALARESTRACPSVEHACAVRADGRGAAAEPPGGRRPPPTEGGSPESWKLDDLKAWIRADVAPIVLIAAPPPYDGRYHYVVLKGYDDEARALLLQDQVDREVALSYERFFPLWCEARGFALVVCAPSIELPDGQAGLTAHELGALGWLAERRGELLAARRHYRAALARDAGYAAAAHNLANVERALAAARAGGDGPRGGPRGGRP